MSSYQAINIDKRHNFNFFLSHRRSRLTSRRGIAVDQINPFVFVANCRSKLFLLSYLQATSESFVIA